MKAAVEKARTESYDKIKHLEDKLAAVESELSKVKKEKEDLNKEHEDLLVMLTEQDAKVLKYKVLCFELSKYFLSFPMENYKKNFNQNEDSSRKIPNLVHVMKRV